MLSTKNILQHLWACHQMLYASAWNRLVLVNTHVRLRQDHKIHQLWGFSHPTHDIWV